MPHVKTATGSMAHSKRQSIEKGNNAKVQFNQTIDGPFASVAWDETTADDSMKQKVNPVVEHGYSQMQTNRKRKSQKVKRKTRMSIEIQRLKEQLYDDKNFIFNS